ncbi:MAG: HAMP domain-containing histidine kinase, partial [Phaeodactylibacter sp.]|nr:HAMP domain-containing histidine kinase [Phaeodactylibacter sp.]
ENASHEMQTPLAVAQGKLDLLLETQGLSDEQLTLVQAIQQSIGKLSKLGKALQLLTKIDNQEFSSQAPVNFSRITEASLEHFSELATLKDLQMSSRIEPNVQISVDPVLADILVGNLLKNAIRHNGQGGWIAVELTSEKLVVRNSGKPPRVPTEQLFGRFQKSHATDGSLGLGLAIVKKIADASQFTVDYQFSEGAHQLTVGFA